MNILFISGSLRQGSYNTMLASQLASLGKELGFDTQVITLNDVPLFNEDLETGQDPTEVAAVKAAVKAADGVIIATPEYNNSVPGVLKNALDWLSRSDETGHKVTPGKKLGVIGASTGGLGTVRAQNELLLLGTILRMQVSADFRLPVSRAQNVFDEQGNVVDQKIQQRMQVFMEQFGEWVENG